MSLSNNDTNQQQAKKRTVKRRSDDWIIAIGQSRGFAIVDDAGETKEAEIEESGIVIAGFLEQIKANPDSNLVAELIASASNAGKKSGLITDKDWNEATTDKEKIALLRLAATRAHRNSAYRAYNQLFKEVQELKVKYDEHIFRYRAANLAYAFLEHADALEDGNVRREPGDNEAIERERNTAFALTHDLLYDNKELQDAFDALTFGIDKIATAQDIVKIKLKQWS